MQRKLLRGKEAKSARRPMYQPDLVAPTAALLCPLDVQVLDAVGESVESKQYDRVRCSTETGALVRL